MKNFQDLTINDYLRIVRRRIWYLIITTVLVSIGSVVYVWRMPSIYKSETTILVSDRLLPEDYIGSLVRQSVMDRIEFARQQVRSRTFVERIAQEFQLVPSGTNSEQVLNAVISSTDVVVVPPNVFKLGYYSTDPGVAQAVTRRLAERVMQSNDAFRQERVNVADQFLDEQLREAADDLAEAEQKLRDLNQRHFPGVPENVTMESLGGLQSQLTVAENDLQAALDQRRAYERSLAEQRELKLAAKSSQPEAVPARPAVAANAVEPVMSPLEARLAQRKADLGTLLTRYTPEHPDVARVTREIRELAAQIAEAPPAAGSATPQAPTPIQTVVKPLPEIDFTVDFYEAEVRRELEQLNREIARKEANKRDLTNRVATYARRMNMPPDVMQELAALTHDREEAKQRHSYLATKKLNSDLAGRVDTDSNNRTFTTIDPPNLPQIPVRPDRRTLTGIGCLAGLLLGIGLVFARELLDPTLSDGESAAAVLKLPVLTSIPVLRNSRREKKLAKAHRNRASDTRKQQSLLALSQDESTPPKEITLQGADSLVREVILNRSTIAGEQFQIMRAELVAQRQPGLKTLIVTSAVPDEGKTLVAACLACLLAKDQGKKVLLVDGDLRTANAARVLGLEDPRSPGLSDVLTRRAEVEDCLVSCADLNLSFLPAGRVANPAELLGSPRLQQVMSDLKLLFDWVIVDAPPVLPIADTNLLIPVCDAAIVVVRASKTPVSLIKESIDRVGRERVRGIVMNFVRDIKATHYYGRYYTRLTQGQE
jgi:polysaccharide chain length determinant protein (PEP-CTERM system associated)